MFVSVQILNLGDMCEEEVALLVCHELAHYLLDHQVLRIINNFLVNNIVYKYLKAAPQPEVYDPTREQFKSRIFI